MVSPRRTRLGLACIVVAVYVCFYGFRVPPFFRSTSSSGDCPADSECAYKRAALNSTGAYPPRVETNLRPPRYRSDGLVEVSTKGRHPIYDLISQAEQTWLAKTRKASKTLSQAVREYKRRYHRDPPKGFDHWWAYAVKHDVKLLDEYDQIYHDLEPFWGLEPKDLHAMLSELETEADITSFVLEKRLDAPLQAAFSLLGDDDKFYSHTSVLVDILQEVEQYLPPFRAILSPRDSSRNLADYNIRNILIDGAHAQSYLSRYDLPNPSSRLGWPAACPPNSPTRQKPINLDLAAPRKTRKTFIHDHHAGSNPCQHPNHLWYHGHYLIPSSPRASGMVPEFSFTGSHLHNFIRIPAPFQTLDSDQETHPLWDDKTDERLLWRGSNTDASYTDRTKWRDALRPRLVAETNDMSGDLHILVSGGKDEVASVKTMKKSMVNPALMDVAFYGSPQSCATNVCEALQSEYPWDSVPPEEYERTHKYVLDVDGDEGATHFKRLMSSNSLVFKATAYADWYMDRIQPWVHYVPIQVDLSDLHDSLVFFHGDVYGEGGHDELAKRIAIEGKKWSRTYFRREDLVAYTFRLLLEYGRLMSPDRQAMSY